MSNQPSSSPESPPYVLALDEGEALLLGARRAPVFLKLTPETGSTRLSAILERVVPGDRVPVHLHEDADEVLFIHAGEGYEILGEEEHAVRSGSLVFVPRGTWHGLRNTSEVEDLVLLVVYSPPGFEGFFRACGTKPGEEWIEPTADEWVGIRKRFKYRVP